MSLATTCAATGDPQVIATTPSLGVRVWAEPHWLALHIANEGGRGMPWRVLFLPLKEASEGAHCKVDLAGIYSQPLAKQRFDAWHRRVPLTSPDTEGWPFIERFTPDAWRRLGSSRVLVVLLFKRCVGEVSDADELAAIQTLLAHPRWCRRGTVEVAERDVAEISHDHAPFAGELTFAVASCNYPAGMLDGTPDDAPLPGPADQSWHRLAQRVNEPASRPSLLLLLGDQIYADATAGLFDPRSGGGKSQKPRLQERWRVAYQNWLVSPHAQRVLGRLISRTLPDDHEIDDNWAPLDPSASKGAQEANQRLRNDALRAYWMFQRDPGPAPWQNGAPPERVSHGFLHRGAAFFMADTRTQRQARPAGQPLAQARIMAPEEFQALCDWLLTHRDRPCFVCSPSMLLPRHLSLQSDPASAFLSDGWDGYPGDLHRLLAFLCDNGLSNVCFLSGDEHLSSVVRIDVRQITSGQRIRAHSVHSSGLYSPFPFANSSSTEFPEHEVFAFEPPDAAGREYECEVEVLHWAPGDGFACVRVEHSGSAQNQVSITFDRAPPAASPTLSLNQAP